MSAKQTRDLKPLDMDDDEDQAEAERLRAYAERNEIPSVSRTAPPSAVADAPAKPARGRKADDDSESELVAYWCKIPKYALQEMKRRAAVEDAGTVRYQILKALNADGIEIMPRDLKKDGRKGQGGGE